jgi:hypothetical protein
MKVIATKEQMNIALSAYLDKIALDYIAWRAKTKYPITFAESATFRKSLKVKMGSKYIKVTKTDNQEVVHSFIVRGEDKKFEAGDILKPAGFNAPTRNAARGNIFGEYAIKWTGPNYL